MKTVTIFYLENCPYCKNAKRALSSLLEEKPAYQGVAVRWVEESREAAEAEKYDYYYVPTAFLGEEKLFEASPRDTYDTLREKLDLAFAAALEGEN